MIYCKEFCNFNHFGTQELIDALESLAAEYTSAYDRGEFDTFREIHVPPNDPNNELAKAGKDIKVVTEYIGGRPVVKEYIVRKRIKPKTRRLCVNDMSLQYGGRFDCKPKENPFIPPHETHMFGEQVDINHLGNPIKMNAKQLDWFKINALKFFESVELHNSNHYHCSKPKTNL